MRAGRSWLRWTGTAASGPESRTPGVDCGGGSDRAMNRIELNRFLFCRIAHHYSVHAPVSLHLMFNPSDYRTIRSLSGSYQRRVIRVGAGVSPICAR